MLEVIKITAVLGFLYGLASIVLAAARHPVKLPLGPIVGIFSVMVFLLVSTITKIGAQEVGVLLTPKGVSNEPLHTGWHFIAPWSSVTPMDRTVWVYTFSNKKDEGQVKGED